MHAFLKPKLSKIKITTNQIYKLRELSNMYKYWKNKINIISNKSSTDFFINHLLSSISIANIVKFINNTLILDAGTGGGLPGIPLAILFDHCKFTLIDSVSKKIKIIKDFIKYLELTNVEVKCTNVKQIKQKFNVIVTRGLYKKLVNYLIQKNIIISENKLFKNVILCITGTKKKLKRFREYKLSLKINLRFVGI
ncbi:16S rRNA (guanine(527)-N(7))-methyltransferase RsmG [Candidatus Karelsulcia muelleri]|uniref:RsmG family class I SAM-dependent methyltransferase n=1 Tax=Candidatus Karelsulcia muelleri TaxID=336810 RepID=UPI00236411E2|nr:RsmG family class I SAM-dependent methyltransferase [Candidatus Karelsulcia muelleri]WDE42233.1 16S rRNA (guanine(527)-N(7))-methyltransferase RsmG [Candidatus Karelsulcia muelleri]WDR79080.1 16S rRNA (guanine(527)-N(7))-methyltransferase RsmG [Candidatus Karelsulcia muelleri]